MGNCLAGETCIFSHDPSKLMNKLNVDGAQTPPPKIQGNLSLQDFNSFPSLRGGGDQFSGFSSGHNLADAGLGTPPGLRFFGSESPRSRSRPASRQQGRELNNSAPAPALDDTEAFPSLGSASATKQSKKHHGKRGGHGQNNNNRDSAIASSMAEVVKMNPIPVGESPRLEHRKLPRNGSATAIRNEDNSAAAQAIPSPKNIPWLETGERANKAYLKARQEAIKHGGLRNKFLQR